MKIGIITFHSARNYGAFLQAYALQQSLSKQDILVNIINYFDTQEHLIYSPNCLSNKTIALKIESIRRNCKYPRSYLYKIKRWYKFKKCIDQEFLLSSKRPQENLSTLEHNYDYFISGSDQVWNIELNQENLVYYLNFVKDNTKKLSYAASFGRNSFSKEKIDIMKPLLSDYKTLLVREESGKTLLKEQMGLDATVVLDPTLLLTPDQWHKFSIKSKKLIKNEYLFVYTIQPPTHLYYAALTYAKKHNLEVVLFDNRHKGNTEGVKVHTIMGESPYEFVHLLSNAEAVFTTSFHSFIFAINFNRTVYYELSKEKANNNARLEDIAHLLNLQSQEITSTSVEDTYLDWATIQKKLEELRIHSLDCLREIIKEP